MPACAPKLPRQRTVARVTFDGRAWPLIMEPGGWRLRSRSKTRNVSFRTGTTNLAEAQRRAKDWLARRAESPIHSRKGGGSLEALAAIYRAVPKRTKPVVGTNNISRLRTVCRVALNRELADVTCREVGPELWQRYQIAALAPLPFDLTTRRRENIAINAAVRAARCLFLASLLPHYRAAGLDARPDAGNAVILPVPYVPPSDVDDAALVQAWSVLASSRKSVEIGPDQNLRLWLAIGLARFAGLRREEIARLRGTWIEERGGSVRIVLRDRPEEQWWTKTGKPYVAQVIEPEVAAWLLEAKCSASPCGREGALKQNTRRSPVGAKVPSSKIAPIQSESSGGYLIPDPPDGGDRARWFSHEPQRWLRAHGVTGGKPLHRLRGLYADHIATLTADAVTARLAGVKAAQNALGHTTRSTTEAHYLTPDALRRS